MEDVNEFIVAGMKAAKNCRTYRIKWIQGEYLG